MPDGMFLKIVDKLNKTEKNKLFLNLVDDDLENKGTQLVYESSSYAI